MTNCLFAFNMSFLLRKIEDMTTNSKPQSLTSVRIKDCTLRVTKLHDYFFMTDNKSNLHFTGALLMAGVHC